MNRTVAIIRTGTANLASVAAAFDRLSVDSRIIESPDQMRTTDAVVLPGVGTFTAGVNALNENGWTEVLINRFTENLPTLAVCLGLQLLAQSSDEAPEYSGLALLPARASRFPETVCSPQLGWNQVHSSERLLRSGYAYFANSYCLQEIQELRLDGWNVATAQHGTEFAAAIRKGNWLACQFHPELSGKYGLMLLRAWLDSVDQEDLVSQSGGTKC